VAIRCVCLLLFCFGIRQDQLVGVPTLCTAWHSKHDSQTALSASASISVSICLNQPQHQPQSVSASASISLCLNQPLPQSASASISLCLKSYQLHYAPRLVSSDRQCKPLAAAPCANFLLCQITSGTPCSSVLLHTTRTCAFKPGCLASHNWLHTPDCKISNGKKLKMIVFNLWHLLTTSCFSCRQEAEDHHHQRDPVGSDVDCVHPLAPSNNFLLLMQARSRRSPSPMRRAG